ncbi:unnamed protein product [Zymoseptoria tritici ST99CH_1A5]|uniref:Uncharacterized protein n=2 Tax=Zymoseptoria tritici TaxID=1047171 RepID=A0A2H1GNA6_ZYMTR|nr:unnamed protein product [Zymoseptoria tritici ST99CH_1E4]SMY25860.1 unnamed protein product [Zymoseptoria tritici ST99CH_1A5]
MRDTLRPLPPAYIRGDYPDLSTPSEEVPRSHLLEEEEEALPAYSRNDPLAEAPLPVSSTVLSHEETLAAVRSIWPDRSETSLRRLAGDHRSHATPPAGRQAEIHRSTSLSSFHRLGDLEARSNNDDEIQIIHLHRHDNDHQIYRSHRHGNDLFDVEAGRSSSLPKFAEPEPEPQGEMTFPLDVEARRTRRRLKKRGAGCWCCCGCGIIGWLFWGFWIVVFAIAVGVALAQTL